MAESTKHPGFARVASKISAQQGVSKEAARRILAARSRQASPSAKRQNPRLRRVKG